MNDKLLKKIDLLVAKHVMKLHVQGCECCHKVGQSYTEDIPKYSLITSEAMWVFEELRRSGEWCCLKMSSDYNYVWDVILIKAEHKGNKRHKPTICVSNESLPIAICLTALQSVGVDWKKELGLS